MPHRRRRSGARAATVASMTSDEQAAEQRPDHYDAFRKRLHEREKRKPINKALFEAVSVNLAALSEPKLQRLVSRKLDVRAALIELSHDREFEASISQGTADIGKVRRRFRAVEQLFAEIAQ